ncbi:MAG: erythromycin esterase family protein [Tannerellaceae bacterium]|jgi:erythromycin esterase|nr:erythromycin esterase family protein [Tannerellaceae bacterium]
MQSTVDFLQERVHRIKSLKPFSKDLDVLSGIAQGARVVAIGEGSHFIREYWELRQRLFECLHSSAGLGIFAMEFGFSEARLVNRWVNGEASEGDLHRFSESIDNWGAGETIRWLRRYNELSGAHIAFAGIDIPEAAGTLLPSLLPFYEFAQSISMPTGDLREAILICDEFASKSAVTAAAKWKKMPATQTDRLAAILANTLTRFTSLRDYYTETIPAMDYQIALRHIEAAVYAEFMIRAVANADRKAAFLPDMSAREYFMARSVMWHLDAHPGSNMFLLAHNNHIQKANVVYGQHTAAVPMGFFLNKFLGDKYCAVAVTSTDNHTADMSLDPSRPVGFKVVDVELGKAKEGSFNAFIENNSLADCITLTDMRGSETDFSSIRSQSAFVDVSVRQAFDAVINLPEINVDSKLGL